MKDKKIEASSLNVLFESYEDLINLDLSQIDFPNISLYTVLLS